MNIGFYLKKIRKEKHYTLNEVAKSTKLTASLLSQIENGKTSPSLNSLDALLKYYKVNISDFFKQVEQKEFILVKKDEAETIVHAASGVSLTLLASKLENNTLDTYVVRLAPGARIAVETLGIETNGERVFVVRRGELTVSISDKKILMREGDSINFKAYVACDSANNGQDECEFFVSGIPPVFSSIKA